MIRHTENGEEFLTAFENDPCYVFVDLFAESGIDQVLASANRENDLDVDLRIRIGHSMFLQMLLQTGRPDGACEKNSISRWLQTGCSYGAEVSDTVFAGHRAVSDAENRGHTT